MSAPNFSAWLEQRQHRTDAVGVYARAMRDVQPDGDEGTRGVPTGFSGHAKAAAAEFAAVRKSKTGERVMSARFALAKIRAAVDELERSLDGKAPTRTFRRGDVIARDLRCPTCRAKPGDFCKAQRGPSRGKRVQPHEARIELARCERRRNP